MLSSFLLGRKAIFSMQGRLKLGAVLVGAFLIKDLCGYEYITTIGVSAVAPLIYYATKYKNKFSAILLQLSIASFSFIMAFGLAIIIHAYSVGNNFAEGISVIQSVALKRIGSPDSAARSCSDLNAVEMTNCMNELNKNKASLAANGLLVVGNYFIFKEFLPWLGNIRYHPGDKEKLLTGLNNLTLSKINPYNFHVQTVLSLAAYGLSCICFIALTVCAFWASFKMDNRAISLLLIISALAPLSWFIMAKGHSYVHKHLNYVLWYIPFLPVAGLTLSEYIKFSNFNLSLLKKRLS